MLLFSSSQKWWLFEHDVWCGLWKQHNVNQWVKNGHGGFTCRGNLQSCSFLWFSISRNCLFFCLFYTEEPFYLKEVYLPTGCSDCVLAYEEVISGNDTFTSLLLFSKKHTSHYTMCESRTLFSSYYCFLKHENLLVFIFGLSFSCWQFIIWNLRFAMMNKTLKTMSLDTWIKNYL